MCICACLFTRYIDGLVRDHFSLAPTHRCIAGVPCLGVVWDWDYFVYSLWQPGIVFDMHVYICWFNICLCIELYICICIFYYVICPYIFYCNIITAISTIYTSVVWVYRWVGARLTYLLWLWDVGRAPTHRCILGLCWVVIWGTELIMLVLCGTRALTLPHMRMSTLCIRVICISIVFTKHTSFSAFYILCSYMYFIWISYIRVVKFSIMILYHVWYFTMYFYCFYYSNVWLFSEYYYCISCMYILIWTGQRMTF
jgi:hypothetical protein